MLRIDTHHHILPPPYVAALRKAGMDSYSGREFPEWDLDASRQNMAALDVGAAIISVSAPGTTFLTSASSAAALARDVNDYTAVLVTAERQSMGFFALLPMPHLRESVDEAVRALDHLGADGVVVLANSAGTYLGEPGQDALFDALNERSAVVFVHPAVLPGPAMSEIPAFAADFLLDTTRAAYLLVRHEIVRRYPNIKFLLSHAGGFLPYASHRMAVAITGDTGRSPADALEDFRNFYFDTALSSSAAALPTLLAFAKPDHITFGSDYPFAPLPVSQLFAAGLRTYAEISDTARLDIERTNALRLFPRLGTAGPSASPGPVGRIVHAVRRGAFRLAVGAMKPTH